MRPTADRFLAPPLAMGSKLSNNIDLRSSALNAFLIRVWVLIWSLWITFSFFLLCQRFPLLFIFMKTCRWIELEVTDRLLYHTFRRRDLRHTRVSIVSFSLVRMRPIIISLQQLAGGQQVSLIVHYLNLRQFSLLPPNLQRSSPHTGWNHPTLRLSSFWKCQAL